MALPSRIGGKIARLIGAGEDEVIVADSTSVNLYKLAWAALQCAKGDERSIVTDDLNFPSDHYVLQGLGEVTVLPTDGVHPPTLDLPEGTGLVSLSGVAFKSGALYPIEQMTREIHGKGALCLWDLSHAVGAVELDLHGSNVDLAVGCTYKYLNGGPGAPAFMYVRRDHQEKLSQPIQGWFGRENAFDFGLGYRPARGMGRFLTGTPPIASLALVEAGVDLLLEAGMAALVQKSRLMTSLLVEMFDEELAELEFRLNTPRAPSERGSHVSFGHERAWPICQALIHEAGVIPDFRAPDTIRFACVPIYGTFTELATAVLHMQELVRSGRDRAYEFKPSGEVT
jgi:kynureninase